MNLFFLQNCYKLKTHDSPILLCLPPTWIISTAIVWEKQMWELTYWCIVEDRIIAWQTRLYYRKCQYWSTVLNRMDWQQKRTTAHNTTWTYSSFKIVPNWRHRTHPLFWIYLWQKWILEMSLDGTNFRTTRIHSAQSVGGDCVIASTLCNQVCKNNVQIQVGTSTNKRSRNQRKNCTGYKYHIVWSPSMSYTIHVIRSTCKLYETTSIRIKRYSSKSKCQFRVPLVLQMHVNCLS